MAVMAPAAPEQALMGLIRSSSAGAVFVATDARISPFGSNDSGSGSGTHHHLNWHTLQATPNPQTAIAISLESRSPSHATDWEHLLNHPSDGFELPLWSSKAAEDQDVSLLGDPLVKHVEDVRIPTPQPQLLEAVEGRTIATATANALVDTAAAAAVAAGPPENPCPAATKASPPRSPPRQEVDVPNTNSRKRKKDRPFPDPKQGEQEGVSSKTGKRCSRVREKSSSETSGESGGAVTDNQQNQPDPHPRDPHPKPEFSKQDYIHVRARRGQATDSHSLAERVRREKISERMKFLQDLVPGCRKVTGKAVMLDEIINYVQSLQRQVESLSMKLASVSHAQSSHWTLESLLSNKEILQTQQFSNNGAATTAASGAFAMQRMPLPPAPPPAAQQQQLASGFDFPRSSSGFLLEHGSRSLETLSVPNFGGLTTTTMRPFHSTGLECSGRDGELQSVVHVGLHQRGQLGSFAGELQCQLPVSRMKVEFC